MSPPSGAKPILPKLKEYKYLYSSNSFLFEAICLLVCIASNNSTSATVARGLICALNLLTGVFELQERRCQALPLITSENAELVDIALEGASNQGPKPNIPEL